MDRHQVDRVDGVDDGVRLVARGEAIEVLGDAADGGVAAVLHAPHEVADLLQVLARLAEPTAAELEPVGRFLEHDVHEVRRRDAVHQPEPAVHGRPRLPEHGLILGVEIDLRGDGVAERLGEARRQRLQRGIRQAHEARPQHGRRPQVGGGVGEVAQQRHEVLDLVGLEEPESLVDVGGDAPRLERRLERLVTLARPEQDARRRRGAPAAGRRSACRAPTPRR